MLGDSQIESKTVHAGGPSSAKQFAEKLEIKAPAPKGAIDLEQLTASLKRCPDTKPSFSANCKAGLRIRLGGTAKSRAHPKAICQITSSFLLLPISLR